jgi:hypothetical protein
MAHTHLIIHSETGFTRAYGQWMAEELGTEIQELSSCKSISCGQGDVVIIGAPVHGSELVEAKRIRKLVAQAADAGARVVVFATGITPPSEHNTALVCSNSGLTDERLSFYYLPGGFDPSRLTQASKTMIFLYRAMMRRQRGRDEELAVLLDRTGRTCDFTDRSLIDSLVMEAKSALGA